MLRTDTRRIFYMPNDIDRNASAQRRTSKLLAAMGIFVALGIIAYII